MAVLLLIGCKEVKWNMGEKKSFYSWNMTFIWTEFFSERFFPFGGAQPPFGHQDRKGSRTPSPCGWWPCSPASACPTWRLFCTARSSYEEKNLKKKRALECQYNVLSAHAWSSWEEWRFWASPLHCSPERMDAGSSSQSTWVGQHRMLKHCRKNRRKGKKRKD